LRRNDAQQVGVVTQDVHQVQGYAAA